MSNVEVPRTELRFFLDDVSDSSISGWIVNTAAPDIPCVVELKEDGRVHARAPASLFRQDLKDAGIGSGHHAFTIQISSALRDGADHLLSLVEAGSGQALLAEPIRWKSRANGRKLPLVTNFDLLETAQSLKLAFSPVAPDTLLQPETGGVETRTSLPLSSDALSPTKRRPAKRRAGKRELELDTYLMFDISDLVYYIGHHPNLTGIQRVQSSVILSILQHRLAPVDHLVFLSLNSRTQQWVSIQPEFLERVLRDLFLPVARRSVYFSMDEARLGVLPGAEPFDGSSLSRELYQSTLCLLGAAWVRPDYMHRILDLKRQFGTRFVLMVHDLNPIYAHDTCDQGTVKVFENFMRRALRHADRTLSVSENTANDIRRYAKQIGVTMSPISVTRNGSSFAEFLDALTLQADYSDIDIPARFVLFVGTIEGRKNHLLMLELWRRLIADGGDPPYLVCVGRIGWKASRFLQDLVETGYLGGKVLLLRDVSDSDLRLLYERCLFTVFPTMYEGWGLTVGEALSLGKICICSDRASTPEVAGELGIYIDIDDPDRCYETIREYVTSAAARRKQEAKIRRHYVPISWQSVAHTIVKECLCAAGTPWYAPYPFPAIPYSSEISFAAIDQRVDGTGDALLAEIAEPRAGVFLSAPLTGESFFRGEEARSVGVWAAPEHWGCWSCHGEGELVLALPPSRDEVFYLCLRLRVVPPLAEHPVRISANGELLWEGGLNTRSGNLILRLRPMVKTPSGWRLRLHVHTSLSPDVTRSISALDSRIPTVGFERLVVVPEMDLKARLDLLYMLLLPQTHG